MKANGLHINVKNVKKIKLDNCPIKVQKMSIQSKSVDIDTHNTHNNKGVENFLFIRF